MECTATRKWFGRWSPVAGHQKRRPSVGLVARSGDHNTGLLSKLAHNGRESEFNQEIQAGNCSEETNMRGSAILTVISLLAASGMLSAQEPQTNKAQKVQVAPEEVQPSAVLCTVYPPKLPSGTSPAGLVVHLYGRRGSHTAYNIGRPPYAALRQQLAERGYWIVVPELGGDHWMNDKAVKTLDTIIAGMIMSQGIDPARVHIIGNSMGAGSGLVYVSQRPGVIRSICAIYPMTDFNAWLIEKPGFAPSVTAAYYDPDAKKVQSILAERSPMQHIDAFAKVPVLLLHGDVDSAVPVHHSQDFAAALTAKGYPITFHEVSGAEHDDRIAEKYQTEMVDFLHFINTLEDMYTRTYCSSSCCAKPTLVRRKDAKKRNPGFRRCCQINMYETSQLATRKKRLTVSGR